VALSEFQQAFEVTSAGGDIKADGIKTLDNADGDILPSVTRNRASAALVEVPHPNLLLSSDTEAASLLSSVACCCSDIRLRHQRRGPNQIERRVEQLHLRNAFRLPKLALTQIIGSSAISWLAFDI
jgi:hypothetical protein